MNNYTMHALKKTKGILSIKIVATVFFCWPKLILHLVL